MADMQEQATEPWFSVVVSVWNRPREIVRSIDSCLSQSFHSFEVVVVDDGSIDDTVTVIESQFDDRRLRLVRHRENQGMSSARDTGVRQAKGQWIVRLDSDHGLLPGALEFLHVRTLEVPKTVGVIGARYQWDTGWISPEFVPHGVVGYIEFLRWWEQEGGHDYLHCERRELYGTVHWPRRRGSMNTLFQLNWARQWNAQFFNEVLGMQYTDATNSYHRAERHYKARGRLRDATDQAWALDEIFRLHGEVLQQYAPTHYKSHIMKAAFFHFLAGHRQQGLRYTMEYISLEPRSPYGWAILAFGLLGKRALLWAYCQKPYFE